MQPFLDKTAEYLINNYPEDTGDICLVLPNRRAGLFLKSYLANRLNKTVWAPSIYAIEDFIFELSGFKVMDPVFLLFELYKVHKEIEDKAAQEFSEFLNWGQVLIRDFNDIDMYLIDAGQLFGYLSDTKALTVWNLDQKPLTDFEVKYLRFFNSLKKYYDKLKIRLTEKRQVYKGLAYRTLAENIEEMAEQLHWKKILFTGFNALTSSEEKIIFSLKNCGIAEMLWDADKYYTENNVQEAGRFIRKYIDKFQADDFKWTGDYFSAENKNINIIGVPQNVGQVKVAGQVLDEIAGKESELSNTAVVLNDETLMVPLLNSIPLNIHEFNLTMGLHLKFTPLFRLVEGFFNLNENAIKFDKTGGKNPRLYHNDIIKILEHPYIKAIGENNHQNNESVSVTSKIRKSNKIFFDYKELETVYFSSDEEFKNIIPVLFEPWKNNPGKGVNKLIELLKVLKSVLIKHNIGAEKKGDKDTPDLEMEYLFHFSMVLKRLKNLLSEYPFIENIRTLRELFNQIVQSITIPFYGEPLGGLQIMGMLETRTLDFENIIMLSVNEDIIPSGKSTNSFISYEIKREFRLPTYREKNSIFAYHFYRILQRAKNIYLLYNTESGELGGGDISRFITQLQYELPKYNPMVRIDKKTLSIPPGKDDFDDTIEIFKTADIVEKLKALAKSGFSPSALNTFRNCPLQFYFKYVAGLSETEEVEETIEAATLGIVIHDVLQGLYTPFIGKPINCEDINSMKSEIEGLIRDSFKIHYEHGEIDYGKNLLIVKVANLFINNFLKKEFDLIKTEAEKGSRIIIKSLENQFVSNLTFEYDKITFDVRLKGTIDRVDELNDTIRIIDYKTGRVEQRDLKFNVWNDLLTESKLDKCFQLLFYGYVYNKAAGENSKQIKPGIISFRNLSIGFLNINLPDNETLSEEAFKNFENVLKKIFQEIFDLEKPFIKTDTIENCKYCNFTSICNR
ncbi:MAG: PD-(D/E)XK nuclease family protein [Bacteroidetes bacterium]|nr:PD-(D/E)XK nuclease family protein [Bacteroidota bacterium]MBL7103617.1 PD-(D/E)XK nuclease family protein [Bacteroidales bacterium]